MPAPTVRLKIRVRLPVGSRACVDPVFSANNKLKPLYGLVDGKLQHLPEGVYQSVSSDMCLRAQSPLQ